MNNEAKKLVCPNRVANKQTSIDIDPRQRGDNLRDSRGYFLDAAAVDDDVFSPSFFLFPFVAAAVVVSFVGKAVLRLMSSQLRHLFYSSQ